MVVTITPEIIFGTVLSSWIALQVTVGILNYKVKRTQTDIKTLKADLDAIALFVGTPRAIAQKKLKEEFEDGKCI